MFFTGRMPFLPPNQQCQSTEGTNSRELQHLLSNPNALVAVSKGIHSTWRGLTVPTHIYHLLQALAEMDQDVSVEKIAIQTSRVPPRPCRSGAATCYLLL